MDQDRLESVGDRNDTNKWWITESESYIMIMSVDYYDILGSLSFGF